MTSRRTDLGEIVEGELVAGLGQLLDDLSDPVARQRQVGGPEKLGELGLADEAIVVHIWRKDGKVRGRTMEADSGTRFCFVFLDFLDVGIVNIKLQLKG